jgi:hypothetical protein
MTTVSKQNGNIPPQLKGYHGGMSSDVSSLQLQKCSDSQTDTHFALNSKSSLNSDPAVINLEVQQSLGSGSYYLDNMYGCDCKLEKAREVQLSQPYVNFSGGKGWMGENGCLIDDDSAIRFDTLTNKKYINQLPASINHGYEGKGEYNDSTESIISQGNLTTVKRSCNVLSGSTTLPFSITPMITRLEQEVQDTQHIIPEDSMNSWVRGGLPTRQIIRNLDYMERCQAKK